MRVVKTFESNMHKAMAPFTSNFQGPGALIAADQKPRREVIHLWPCYPPQAVTSDLEKVVDETGAFVKGNKLWSEPDLFVVAGLPDQVTDAQCHGAQLELWVMRGATMRRDICPRVIDADLQEPGEDKEQRDKQNVRHANKFVRRRQAYRKKVQGGLMPQFEVNTETFARTLNGMTDDQFFLV